MTFISVSFISVYVLVFRLLLILSEVKQSVGFWIVFEIQSGVFSLLEHTRNRLLLEGSVNPFIGQTVRRVFDSF